MRTWSENGVHTAAGLLHRIDRQADIDYDAATGALTLGDHGAFAEAGC